MGSMTPNPNTAGLSFQNYKRNINVFDPIFQRTLSVQFYINLYFKILNFFTLTYNNNNQTMILFSVKKTILYKFYQPDFYLF